MCPKPSAKSRLAVRTIMSSFVHLLPSDGAVVVAPLDTACRSSFIQNLISDAGHEGVILLPLVDSQTLELTLHLLDDADKGVSTRRFTKWEEEASTKEVLRLASAANFLDVPDLLESTVSVLTHRLRGIAVSQLQLLEDSEESVTWPAQLSEDVAALVIERLGFYDTCALLATACAVSPAWARGAPERLRVAHRVWAAGCTLHDLAGRTGRWWYGEHVDAVLAARLKYHGKQAYEEARTIDDGAGWLPLHHAAFQAKSQPNQLVVQALVDVFPEGRLVKSKSVHLGHTPQDLARVVHAPHTTQMLLDPSDDAAASSRSWPDIVDEIMAAAEQRHSEISPSLCSRRDRAELWLRSRLDVASQRGCNA